MLRLCEEGGCAWSRRLRDVTDQDWQSELSLALKVAHSGIELPAALTTFVETVGKLLLLHLNSIVYLKLVVQLDLVLE